MRHEIAGIFNRALAYTFDRTKWIVTFCVLALCGLLVVFSRGLAIFANTWFAQSLAFLPIFLCSGILLALGIVLIRAYHNEVKQLPVNYPKILSQSWEIMLGTIYCTLPVILLYLTLWVLLGVFLLLRQLPLVGDFFAVILAFAPFLLNLATLLLCVFMLGILFFFTPLVALKGFNRSLLLKPLAQRFRMDPFSNLLYLTIALVPFAVYLGLLLLATLMTGSMCSVCEDALKTSLQWFFIMIPFAAILAPAVIFFFNFAAEAHVLMQKKQSLNS